MPALPDVPSVLRVALSGGLAPNAQWFCRFYTQYTGTAPTNTQLNTFAGSVRAGFNTNLKALLSNSNTLTLTSIADLTSATAAVGQDSTTVTGTRTGGNTPDQDCLVISYEIGRRYRGGHPRGYWPFGTLTDVSTGRAWAAAFVTAAQTGIDAFFTAVNAAGWSGAGTLSHVNVSYYKGFTVVTSPTTGRARNVPTLRGTPIIDAVTSTLVRASIGTQRRRQNFVG